MAYMQVVALSRLGEPESRTVFFFALGCTLLGGVAMPFTGISPGPAGKRLWLLPLGLLAAGGQLCMTRPMPARQTAARHAGGGQPAVLGIVFAGLYSLVLVRRQPAAPSAGWAWCSSWPAASRPPSSAHAAQPAPGQGRKPVQPKACAAGHRISVPTMLALPELCSTRCHDPTPP